MKTMKIIKNKNTVRVLIAAVMAAGFSQASRASITFPSTPGLFLVDDATGKTAFAAEGANGQASFSGTVGDYSVAISATGITLAGGAFPSLDLDVANAQAGAGATSLEVYYSNGPFGPSSGSYVLSTYVSSGTVVSTAYGGTSDFDLTSNLGGSSDTAGAVTVNTTGQGTTLTPYYLTLEDLITGSEVSADSSFRTIPETSTVLAGSLMLLPLGVGVLRSLRKERLA